MALVSISKAIELSGVSRGTFYRNYLNKGHISISKDHAGKKQIDTSELLRVFPNIKLDTVNSPESPSGQLGQLPERTTPDNSEIKLLKQQIEDLKADKAWLQDQVTNLTDSIKLLEAPKHHRHWWLFWK